MVINYALLYIAVIPNINLCCIPRAHLNIEVSDLINKRHFMIENCIEVFRENSSSKISIGCKFSLLNIHEHIRIVNQPPFIHGQPAPLNI